MIEHASSSGDPIGQIADEFAEALRRGERPSVEEYVRRYPHHAKDIRRRHRGIRVPCGPVDGVSPSAPRRYTL